MNDLTTETDLFDRPPTPLPGMLNVLTILTYIGCGISYLGALYNMITSFNYDQRLAKMQEMQDKMGESNSMTAKMIEGSITTMQKTHEYRYILFVSALLFTSLCLVGAMQMRKLKKDGYTLYIIGELAPLVITGALLGFNNLLGGIAMLVSLVFAMVFVILYTTQRKFLS